MRVFTPRCNRKQSNQLPLKVPYRGYLTGDHWEQTKDKSRALYGSRCVVCLSDGPIHRHHLFYSDHPTYTKAHHVVPLCEDCHKGYHTAAPDRGLNREPMEHEVSPLIKGLFTYAVLGRGLTLAYPLAQEVAKRAKALVRQFLLIEENHQATVRRLNPRRC